MSIEINEGDAVAIRSHGEETFPQECCGFLLGTAKGVERHVVELMRAYNDREEEARHNRFLRAIATKMWKSVRRLFEDVHSGRREDRRLERFSWAG